MRSRLPRCALFAGALLVVLPVFASSKVLAQEPEAAVPRRQFAPHPRIALPRTRRSSRLHEAGLVDRKRMPEAASRREAAPGTLQAVGTRHDEANTAAEQQAAPQPRPIPPEIQQFCSNNAAIAGQTRVAWEAAKLKELEAKLRQRIGELEAKRAEYENWLHKREEALKKAGETIVAIYTRMRPDAAALQLAAMDDNMAAAVLAKLKPANASAILNEMEPGRAARLAATMVGSNPAADGKKT